MAASAASSLAAVFSSKSDNVGSTTLDASESSIQSSLLSVMSATATTTTTTGTDTSTDLSSPARSTLATSTSGDTPTKAAGIGVPASTVTSGADPIYDLSLDSSELSSYGNPSDNEIAFLCANGGCQVAVENQGYTELWRAIMNTTSYKATPPHTKINSLVNGTNSYSLRSINQDDVNWRNESCRYVWTLFDSEDGVNPIAMSSPFQMHISEWNYTGGLPQAGASGTAGDQPSQSGQSGQTNETTGPKSTLAGGAIAGIVIGILLIVVIALVVFFLMRRRKRQRKRLNPPSGVHEKGVDNPSSKPELVGTTPTTSGVPYNKPELGATTKPLPSEMSSSQSASLPYEGGAGAPTEPDREQDKQLVETERLVPSYMEVRESQTGEPSSPSTQNRSEGDPLIRPATHENLNVLKAQERELSHKMEVSESLQRLRAEHAALLDRIRIAEMREREVHGL